MFACALKWCWLGTLSSSPPSYTCGTELVPYMQEQGHCGASILLAGFRTVISLSWWYRHQEPFKGVKAEETQKEHFLRAYSVPAPVWGLYVNCVSIPAALWLDSLRTFHYSLPQFSAGERGVQDNQSLTTHTTPRGHPSCLPFLPQWPESDVANPLWREGRWPTLLMRTVVSVVWGLKQRFILHHHIMWMGPPDSFPAWLL